MKRGNEALVGGAVLLALALVIGGALYLSQTSFRERDETVVARFRTIGGLSAGAQVTRSGVRIGRVEAVRLAEGEWVEVEFSLRTGIELPADPVVIVASSSLFGEWQASILPRTAAPDDPTVRDMLAAASEAGGGVLPGATLPDIGELTSQANRIATDVRSITSKVEGTIDDQVMADIRSSVASLREMSEQLSRFTSQQSEVLAGLTKDLTETSRLVNRLSVTTLAVMARVDSGTSAGELQRLFANSSATSEDLRQVITDLKQVTTILADNRSSLTHTLEAADSVMTRVRDGRGTLSMLASDSTLYLETTRTLGDLRALLADIKANPRRYFKFSVF